MRIIPDWLSVLFWVLVFFWLFFWWNGQPEAQKQPFKAATKGEISDAMRNKKEET